jgi:predicted nucleic acid-binding protein
MLSSILKMLGLRPSKAEDTIPLLATRYALDGDHREKRRKGKVAGIQQAQVRFKTLRATDSGDDISIYEKTAGATRTLETTHDRDTTLQRDAIYDRVEDDDFDSDDVGNELRRRRGRRRGRDGGVPVTDFVIQSDRQ